MGACLDIQPQSRPFALEGRRESFYLSTSPLNLVMHGRRGANGVPAAISVPREHVTAFAAVLDQMAEWPHAAEQIDATSVLIDPWSVDLMADMLVIQGPVTVYGADTSWGPIGELELNYSGLTALRNAIRAAVAA